MPDAYSKNIVYLSQTQYQELITNNNITVNGATINYNDNDIYVTPQAEPITDVKINNVSIGSNGIANIPKITDNTLGLVKARSWSNRASSAGISFDDDGMLAIVSASANEIKQGASPYRVCTPYTQDASTFYGLSKIAGVDLANENVTFGTYPDTSKAAIQNLLGISDLIGNKNEGLTASKAYAINDIFTANGKLYKATAAIVQDATIIPTTNCEETSLVEGFVKWTDYATNGTYGLMRTNVSYGTSTTNYGHIQISSANSALIKSGYNNVTGDFKPIVVNNQHEAVFYGLAKVAGADEKDSELPLGTYSAAAKAAIQTMLGVPSVASIPTATSDLTNDTYYVSASFDNNNGLVLATAASWAEEASF